MVSLFEDSTDSNPDGTYSKSTFQFIDSPTNLSNNSEEYREAISRLEQQHVVTPLNVTNSFARPSSSTSTEEAVVSTTPDVSSYLPKAIAADEESSIPSIGGISDVPVQESFDTALDTKSSSEVASGDDDILAPPRSPPSQTIAVERRSMLRRIEESYKTMAESFRPVNPSTPPRTPDTEIDSGEVSPPGGALDEVPPLGLQHQTTTVTSASSRASPVVISEQQGRPSSSRMSPVILRMPNTAFGVSMGLAGNAIMWNWGNKASFVSSRVNANLANNFFWSAGIIVGIMVMIAYMYKAIVSFDLVRREYKCPSRIHFMNGPNLTLMMLSLSVPRDIEMTATTLRVLFGICGLIQLGLTQFIYEKWMFSSTNNLSLAQPQFLLSTVGWFLLANLGNLSGIEEAWGLALPSFCFGIGFLLYILVVASLFSRLHKSKSTKGQPSLTLLIAPPSVGVVALDGLDGRPLEFSVAAEMLLGWCLCVTLLLAKLGPKIVRRPAVLGEYWAYVFPLSALGAATVKYGMVEASSASQVLAAICMGIATLAILVVCIRMFVSTYECVRGKSDWDDPLVKRVENEDAPTPNDDEEKGGTALVSKPQCVNDAAASDTST